MDAESGGIGAAAGAVAAAIIGGLVKLVGTRRERAESEAIEAGPAERAAALALAMAERATEDTQRHRIERDGCEERLSAMDQRVRALETAHDALARDHARCPERIATLERQVERLTLQSTPPLGIHPDDVRRAAMAHEETGP